MLLQRALWGGQHVKLLPAQPPQQCVAVRAAAAGSAAAAVQPWAPEQPSHLSASSLTMRIMHASSTAELLQLHAAHRSDLDSIHYAAMFSRLLHAGGQSSRAAGHHHHYNHQQQQLQHPHEHRQQLLQALLADLPYVAHTMLPGPLSAVLRALVKLQVQPEPQLLLVLLYRAHRGLGFGAFAPWELCTVAHALSELQPVHLPWTAAAAAGRPAILEQQQQAGSGSWDPLLLQDLFYALGRSLPRCNAQDAAQALLAVARLRYTPSEAWLQVWLQRATQLLPHFSPQGLANAAYGLVRTLQLRGDVADNGSSHCVWAQQASASSSSRIGSDGSDGGVSTRKAAQAGVHLQQQRQQQQQQHSALRAAAHAWLVSCLKVSALHLSTLKPQELIGQLLWAAGKLSCGPPDPARHHLLSAAESMLPACDARHLSAALYAFALLGHRPHAAAAAVFWSCLSRQGSNLRPRDLDEVLWSAGQLQLQPPGAVREQLQQQALLLLGGEAAASGVAGQAAQQQQSAKHPSALQMQTQAGRGKPEGPRHVVGVLRGIVGLGWELQDKYVVRVQGTLLEQLDGCVPQDFSNALWALATAGAKVEARFLDRILMAASSSLEHFTAQQLSNTLWALAQLQHHPPKPWLQQLLLAALQQMSVFKPIDFAQMLWGLSKLGFSPSPLWLSSFWSKCGHSLTESNFRAAELRMLLLAAANLDMQPPQKWVQAAAGGVERGLTGFKSSQLLEVLQALQQLWQASSTPALSSSSSECPSAFVIGGNDSSSSGSGSGRCAPGVLRLYRHVLDTTRVAVPGQRLMRPVWPPLPASNGTLMCASSSSGGSSDSGMPQQLQQLSTVSCAEDAYSLACLVVLMPQQLRARVEHWPQVLAGDGGQRLQLQDSTQQTLLLAESRR